jgi:hypothetical protein
MKRPYLYLMSFFLLSPVFVAGTVFAVATSSTFLPFQISTSAQIVVPLTATTTLKTATGGLLIKKVGSDLTVLTAPANYVAYDGGLRATQSALVTLLGITPGRHIVETNPDTIYQISYATCQYQIGSRPCTVTNLSQYKLIATTTDIGPVNGYNSIPVEVKPGLMTKVVFRYTKPPMQLSQTSVKIEFISSIGSTTSRLLDAKGGIVTIPNGLYLKPVFADSNQFQLPTGILGFMATNTPLEGYSVSAGVCQYSGTAKDCGPLSYSDGACSDSVCSVYLPYAPGVNQKIVYKYVTQGTYSLTSNSKDTIVISQGASTTIPVMLISIGTWNQPVSLSVSGLPIGSEAAVDQVSCIPQCSQKISIQISSSTPLGIYPVMVIGQPLGRRISLNVLVTANSI